MLVSTCVGDRMIKLRKADKWGQGHFGAPRGNRTHNGVDVCTEAHEEVCSHTYGLVTKIGYPYNPKDPKKGFLRYVEVTLDGNRFRYFYIAPALKVGEIVTPGMVLGHAQDLDAIYPGITQHYHFEIIDPNGQYVNPADMLPEFSNTEQGE